VALGGLGGVIGGFGGFGGSSTTPSTKSKITITPPGGTTIASNPPTVTPLPPIVPSTPPTIGVPTGPTVPGSPPTQVPEPSTLAVFLFAATVALAARHFHRRRMVKATVFSA
jgi:hypothetical protein